MLSIDPRRTYRFERVASALVQEGSASAAISVYAAIDIPVDWSTA